MTALAQKGLAWARMNYPTEPERILRVECAWCNTTLREGADPTSKVVTHGLCESCKAVHFPGRE